VHLADATAAGLIDTEPDSKKRPGQDLLGDDIVIQPRDRVGADACNECEPVDSERPGAVLYFPQGEPLASAGAPRRELLQRHRQAGAS
jgi:hypothetical protein